MSKADKGHQKHSFNKTKKYMNKLVEIRDFPEEKEVGSLIDCGIFSPGEKVFVSGTGKGKGFQGVVKKHGMHGGRKTHGSHFHRSPGSIGACAFPGEVEKGKKMPGRMGGKRVNVKNIQIVDVNSDENLMYLKGSLPGNKNTYLHIYQK